MITRILPRADYWRLVGTELETVYPHLPADARVIVVEDDGEIVGCWSLFPLVHVEGVWIDPKHRGGSVARRLLSRMRAEARDMGARTVQTAAVTKEVEDLALRIGGFRLPGAQFTIKLT